jgi:hypothetical protein
MAQPGRLRKLLLGISPSETGAGVRGFPEQEAPARRRLESVGGTFVQGYMAGLEAPEASRLESVLEQIPLELRGFAYEGAAMSLGLLDRMTPWNRGRLAALLRGRGAAHEYMLYVGLGWARARLKSRRSTPAPQDCPLLGWLTFDGIGFHEGFFHWQRSFLEQRRSAGMTGPAGRVFDQGLGRCAWFVFGAQVERIARVFASFAAERHEDLWGGVGLAAAYAGGVPDGDLAGLRELAGPHAAALGQGAAFAAQARERAGNPAAHTERACREFLGASGRDAAALTQLTLEALPSGGAEPAYLTWRARIRDRLK